MKFVLIGYLQTRFVPRSKRPTSPLQRQSVQFIKGNEPCSLWELCGKQYSL